MHTSPTTETETDADGRPAPEAFDAAYARLGPSLLGTAYLLTLDRTEAHDVVHDAFAAAYPRWATLEEPAAYLRRSVTHAAYKVGRDRRRRADKHLRAVADRPGEAPPADAGVEVAALAELVAALPHHQRAVIVLRFHLDLSHAEIADALGIRPGSVGPTLTRALRRLEIGLRP